MFFCVGPGVVQAATGADREVQGVGKEFMGKYFPVPGFQLFIAGAWERELQTPLNHPG